jgi:hypothetical protein
MAETPTMTCSRRTNSWHSLPTGFGSSRSFGAAPYN